MNISPLLVTKLDFIWIPLIFLFQDLVQDPTLN